MGPILLGAPLPSQRCMRDLGTDSIPTGYKLMRRVSHTVGGLRLGSKANLRRVVRLDKQTEPRRAHSWAWPLWLGTRFRRQSRAPKGAPLTGKGIDCSARPARGSSCQKWNDAPRGKVPTPRRGAVCDWRGHVRWLWHGSRKRLTPRPSRIRRGCASPRIMMWSKHSRRIDPISRSAKPLSKAVNAGAATKTAAATTLTCVS
jgi:hypothetical protein